MTLSVDNLTFGYGTTIIGENVSLSLSSGKVLGLLGPNGAGKTTLFKTILGLLPTKTGSITLDGELTSSWSRQRRARAMAYVPQAHTAVFPYSVRDIVLMGRAAHIDQFSRPGKRDIEIATDVLETFGIGELADRPYTEISGGERQIALIARAVVQQPRLLVMDEPTASLDYGNQLRVLNYVRKLAKREIAVILSTHNPDHAFLCADEVALFQHRRITAMGAPDKVLTALSLKELYDVDVVIGSVSGSAARICVPVLNGSREPKFPSVREDGNGPGK